MSDSETAFRLNTALIHSLVSLGHNLGMRVIVEGIETEGQLELIRSLGANEVQGFLLGRPTADPLSHLCLYNSTIPVEQPERESHALGSCNSEVEYRGMLGRLAFLILRNVLKAGFRTVCGINLRWDPLLSLQPARALSQMRRYRR